MKCCSGRLLDNQQERGNNEVGEGEMRGRGSVRRRRAHGTAGIAGS